MSPLTSTLLSSSHLFSVSLSSSSSPFHMFLSPPPSFFLSYCFHYLHLDLFPFSSWGGFPFYFFLLVDIFFLFYSPFVFFFSLLFSSCCLHNLTVLEFFFNSFFFNFFHSLSDIFFLLTCSSGIDFLPVFLLLYPVLLLFLLLSSRSFLSDLVFCLLSYSSLFLASLYYFLFRFIFIFPRHVHSRSHLPFIYKFILFGSFYSFPSLHYLHVRFYTSW